MISTIAVIAITGVVAQTASSEFPSWATWGVLGLVVAGFVTKQLVPGWMYADLKSENKDLRLENARLVQLTLDTQAATLPAIEASTSAVSDALTELRSLRQQRGQ